MKKCACIATLTCCFVFCWLAPSASAYSGTAALDYSGQLSGFAATWKEWWEPAWESICVGYSYDPYDGSSYCTDEYYWNNQPFVTSELIAPSGQQVWSGSAVDPSWAQVTLPPITPSQFGTWDHRAVHYQFQRWWYVSAWFPGSSYVGDEYSVIASSSASASVPWPPPSISGLAPVVGMPGTQVTITGSYFGSSGSVRFNGIVAAISAWSQNAITAIVPSGAATGPVVVSANGQNSNAVTFSIRPGITGLSPAGGLPGQVVTIAGTAFGNTQGNSSVSFNGVAAIVTTWSATSIKATVPTTATSGVVVVTVGGYTSNGVAFSVLTPPVLSSMLPPAGAVGQSITITGSNFGPAQGTSSVRFGTLFATVSTWSTTAVTVLVPPGTATGPVTLQVNGLTSNPLTFTLTPEEVRYYHADAVGSTRLVTDANGATVARYDYLPFGEPFPADSAAETRRFAGLERTVSTGNQSSWGPLDYAGARYYESQIGRFTTADRALNVQAAMLNPQLWNKYVYVSNNPLRKVDPDGRWERDIHYTLTRVLALGAGFSTEDARSIAFFDQYLDDYPPSSPTRLFAVEARSRFHFTTPERRQELWDAFADSRSLEHLGMFMHAEQDSWSHAGLGASYGQLLPLAVPVFWSAADWRYFLPQRADAMAKDSFEQLRHAAAGLGISPRVSWNEIARIVERLNRSVTEARFRSVAGELCRAIGYSSSCFE